MSALFSIIVPTYNRAFLLSNAINSIFSQQYKDFELIIVDDGSSDNTKNFIESFNDSRIRYIYQENKGVCVARNTGIYTAQGKYITFLDSDDLAESNWLEDFYTQIQKNEPDLIFCDMLLKYPDGRSVVRKARFRYDTLNPNENGMYMPGAFCIKSELLKRIGGFDPNIKFGEFTDIDFSLQREKYSRAFTNEIGIHYCPTPDGGAKNQKNKIAFIEYILKKHADIFENDKATKICYLQNAGVSCARINEYQKSRSFFLKAYLLNPFKIKNLIRCLLTFIPLLSSRIWKI